MRIYHRNPTIRLIVFDLDGTLYPRETYMRSYYWFTVRALEKLAHLKTSEAKRVLDRHDVSPVAGDSRGSVTQLVERYGIDREAWNAFRDLHFDITEMLTADPSVREAMDALRIRYKLALVTNNTSNMTVKILSHLEYDLDVFRAIITSGDVDGAKPGTEAFFRLRAMLGESFESMLSVGDRKEVDIDPMLALGGSGILIDGPREIVTLANILLE